MPARAAFPKSEAAARRALAIDDSLSQAHLVLAKVKLFYDWDWPGFESGIERALSLDPHDADAHSMRGTYLLALGRFDEAIAERKRAQELDPLSLLLTTGVWWAYYYARQYDRAIEWYKNEEGQGIPPTGRNLSSSQPSALLAELHAELTR